MHEVRRRPMTVEERAHLDGWCRGGCLLSFLLDKLDNSSRRLVDADLAAGETEVLTFVATRCAKAHDGYYFILDGGDGWFLGLEGAALSDAEVVETSKNAAVPVEDGEVFSAQVEVTRAPGSGLIHSVRLDAETVCPVVRVLRADRLNWESVLFRSTWDRLEHDVQALRAATQPADAPPSAGGSGPLSRA